MNDKDFLFTPLKENDKIVFGPFVGELGWEITKWCGFVRWFKLKNPKKTIVAATRTDRIDLYYKYVDNIITFEIEGDYSKFRPNMYRLDFFPEEKYNKIISEVKKNFKDYYIASPPRQTNNRQIFNMEMSDFNFITRENNMSIISSILKVNKGRIPIVISPRHREDLGEDVKRVRNWKKNYWHELYELIEKTENYVCFIAGKSPSYIKPDKSLKSFVILEDLLLPTIKDISLIGLTLQSIIVSKITIGQQSSIPILSNYLKTPTIMWGDEQHRHQVLENPFSTLCEFFEEKSSDYITDPKLICSKLMKMTE